MYIISESQARGFTIERVPREPLEKRAHILNLFKSKKVVYLLTLIQFYGLPILTNIVLSGPAKPIRYGLFFIPYCPWYVSKGLICEK